MSKVKVAINIGGDKRKGSCWAKHVTEIDDEKQDGYMFIGNFLRSGEYLLEKDTIILQVETIGSWKNKQQHAYLGLVNEEGKIVWDAEIDGVLWSMNKVTIAQKCQELLNQKQPQKISSQSTNEAS